MGEFLISQGLICGSSSLVREREREREREEEEEEEEAKFSIQLKLKVPMPKMASNLPKDRIKTNFEIRLKLG